MTKVNEIICGDNIEVMAKMPANSIDTIITGTGQNEGQTRAESVI